MHPLLRVVLARLLALLPMLLALSMASFALVHVIPGDPALVMMGGEGTTQAVEELRRQLGLDRPLHVRYLEWLGRISTLGRPVIAIGGITADRVGSVVAAGAWGVAAIRSLWYDPDPARAVRFGEPTYDEMMGSFIDYTIEGQPLKPIALGNGQPSIR